MNGETEPQIELDAEFSELISELTGKLIENQMWRECALFVEEKKKEYERRKTTDKNGLVH